MTFDVFWVAMSYGSVDRYQRFGGTFCLHLQGWSQSWRCSKFVRNTDMYLHTMSLLRRPISTASPQWSLKSPLRTDRIICYKLVYLLWTPWSDFLLNKLIRPRTSLTFTDSEGLLQCSQGPGIFPSTSRSPMLYLPFTLSDWRPQGLWIYMFHACYKFGQSYPPSFDHANIWCSVEFLKPSSM
jgi:hypothetical protein